ncbi:hypothetical protein FQR65_LT10441 [Abscondita terminalis]|nr:hypothetical protein FQR65_LT10441 [Abscondita terminalis]
MNIDLKVSDLRLKLQVFGIETKGLKKNLLMELLSLVLSSSLFYPKNEQSEIEKVDQQKFESDIAIVCATCDSLKEQIDNQLKNYMRNCVKNIDIKTVNVNERQSFDVLSAFSHKSDSKNVNNLTKVFKKNKILILSDSQGRGLYQEMFKVYGGTNDRNYDKLMKTIIDVVNECIATNLIISTIPYRYDLQSSYNNYVHQINVKLCDHITKLRRFNNKIDVFDFNSKMMYEDYARHGLHLNKQGKSKLINRLAKCVSQFNCVCNNVMNLIPISCKKETFQEKDEDSSNKTSKKLDTRPTENESHI